VALRRHIVKLAGLSSETQMENSLTINEPHVLHHSTRTRSHCLTYAHPLSR